MTGINSVQQTNESWFYNIHCRLYKPVSNVIHLMPSMLVNISGVLIFLWHSWKSVLVYLDVTKPFVSPFYRCRTENWNLTDLLRVIQQVYVKEGVRKSRPWLCPFSCSLFANIPLYKSSQRCQLGSYWNTQCYLPTPNVWVIWDREFMCPRAIEVVHNSHS